MLIRLKLLLLLFQLQLVLNKFRVHSCWSKVLNGCVAIVLKSEIWIFLGLFALLHDSLHGLTVFSARPLA